VDLDPPRYPDFRYSGVKTTVFGGKKEVLINNDGVSWFTMARYTQPDKAQQLLLAQLGIELPPKPRPTITLEQINPQCGEAPSLKFHYSLFTI